MGEVALALRRNARCGWAFLFVVPGKYIVTLILIFTLDTSFQYFPENYFSVLLFLAIPYIGVQILLWALYLRTWGVWEWPKRR